MHLEPSVRHTAKGFLLAISAGTVPLFIYTVLRGFMDGLGQTRMSMRITLISLPVNSLMNYLFIFGAYGFPRLGGIGAGVASAITYWCICILAIALLFGWSPLPHMGHRINGTAFRGKPGAIFCGLGCRSDLQYSSKPASFRPLRFS